MDNGFDSTIDMARKALGISVLGLGTMLLVNGAATCDEISADVFIITSVLLTPIVGLSLVSI